MEKESSIIKEMEVIYHPTKLPVERITSPLKSVNLIRQFYNPDKISVQEECIVFYLNNSNVVTGFNRLSRGGISAVIVDIRLILATALKSLSSAVLIAHNHPSGNVKPSQQDIDLTNRLNEACKLMELSLLDHVIITHDSYYSFIEEGMIR